MGATEKQPKTYSVEPKRKHLSKDVKKTDNISSEKHQRQTGNRPKTEVEAAKRARLAAERLKLAQRQKLKSINLSPKEKTVSDNASSQQTVNVPSKRPSKPDYPPKVRKSLQRRAELL